MSDHFCPKRGLCLPCSLAWIRFRWHAWVFWSDWRDRGCPELAIDLQQHAMGKA